MWGTTGVSVSPSSLTMTKGETKQLDGSVSYFGNYPGYSWSTNNKSVATVDGAGNVKAIAAGTAKITLTSGTLSASCTVTVKAAATGGSSGGNSGTVKPAPAEKATATPTIPNNNASQTIKLTSVSVSPTDKYLEIGETISLGVTVKPMYASNQSLKWESSDTNVATVNQKGVVTAKSGGIAIITATAQDGYGAKGSCNIRVGFSYPAIAVMTPSDRLDVFDTVARQILEYYSGLSIYATFKNPIYIGTGYVYYETKVSDNILGRSSSAAIQYELDKQKELFSNFSLSAKISDISVSVNENGNIGFSASSKVGETSTSLSGSYNYFTSEFGVEYSFTNHVGDGTITSKMGIKNISVPPDDWGKVKNELPQLDFSSLPALAKSVLEGIMYGLAAAEIIMLLILLGLLCGV
ncbi:hypothetical protein AGMMS50284_7520 [Clostridia bacterium]|nr:hypothetical protein AGMMS50284_7520 [Clostridia bacterium]